MIASLFATSTGNSTAKSATQSAAQGSTFGLAWLALSSGELGLTECNERDLGAWLVRLAPAEVLVDPDHLRRG